MGDVFDEEVVRCENCGSYSVEDGYEMHLCKECRKKLSKRSIPKAIILCFIVIMMILGLSLMMSIKDFNLAILREKSNESIEDKNYDAAIKQYEELHKEYPDNRRYSIRLLELYYYGDYIKDACNLYDSLVGVKMEKTLIKRAVKIMDNIEKYYVYHDDVYNEVSKIKDTEDADVKVLELVSDYVTKNGIHSDYCASSVFIDSLICKEKYDEALNYCSEIISNGNEEFNYAYYQLGVINVALGNEKGAEEAINHLLSRNNDSVYAKIIQSRLELKKKNYKKAFELAEKAYNLNPNNDRACLNLAVAYYYNGDKEQAEISYDECYDNVNKTSEELNWLDNVFSGKVVLD